MHVVDLQKNRWRLKYRLLQCADLVRRSAKVGIQEMSPAVFLCSMLKKAQRGGCDLSLDNHRPPDSVDGTSGVCSQGGGAWIYNHSCQALRMMLGGMRGLELEGEMAEEWEQVWHAVLMKEQAELESRGEMTKRSVMLVGIFGRQPT